MTARDAAHEAIVQALLEFTPQTVDLVRGTEQAADVVLAALVGAGLDAHDWLRLIGIEVQQCGWRKKTVYPATSAPPPTDDGSWEPVYRLGLRGSEE